MTDVSDESQPESAAGSKPAAEPKAATEPPKELTPEEYSKKYETEQAEGAANIHAVHGVSDVMTKFQEMLPFGGGSPGGMFGKTDFDDHPLNSMLDLIQQANPSDLQHAGDALIKAKDKLNEAAEELDQYVTTVAWEGEGAEEFRRYGRALAQHAWSVGTFANSAGTQMKTASTGLASVQGAMPPRDDRPVEKRPEKFDPAEQVADNAEYQKALKAEENRQEAITQMNRVASFYAVSEEMLAGQEVPAFPEGLQAAVPPPSGDFTPGGGANTSTGAAAASRASGEGTPSESAVGTAPTVGTAVGGTATPAPQQNVSMGIDSVAAPPAPTTATGPTPPPTTSTSGPTNGFPPFATGPVNPVQMGTGRPTSTVGTSRPTGPIGRPSTTGTSGPTTGRSPGITGRPTSVGTGQTTSGRSNPVGRPGIVGGTPAAKPAGGTGQTAPLGRAGASGIRGGTPNGIMGGSPQRAGTGSASSRLPRGTVVGGEGSGTGRGVAARPGQSGVIGSNSGNSQRPAGRGTSSSNGVVGTPRGSNTGRAGASFTAGGAGLAGKRPDEEEQSSTARPDYLTEDEETWTARRRGAVPPVID